MGKVAKPLTLVVFSPLDEWPEIVKLEKQGHTIVRITPDSSYTGDYIVALKKADIIMGPRCWYMTELHRKHLTQAIKQSRLRRYGTITKNERRVKTMKKTWIALILSLTLVASGCAVSSQQLLGSPNFVKENLPALLSIEQEAKGVLEQIQMMAFMGINLEEAADDMQDNFNAYWVYYNAANVYLSSGNRDLFVQAIARAELALQKIRDIIDESLDSLEAPAPETKVENLSL